MTSKPTKKQPNKRKQPTTRARALRKPTGASRATDERKAAAKPTRVEAAPAGKEPAASPPHVDGFPIVGIGASAGGLEALEQFLTRVPMHSGMAYIVIQHLDPTHKGAMVELLQRVCRMPVVQVQDRQKVVPDSVYVIPPSKDMSILHGVLHLLPQTSPRGLNLPIDFFFRSLAEDQQERSIGVILSGMGSDGTLGVRAIKEKAGAAFVQSLASAKFASMPQSVIGAGLADVVASAEELPNLIMAYRQHAPYIARPEIRLEERQLSALEKVFVVLRAQTGNDFSLYKRSTIYRRIERRMGLHQVDKIPNYVRYLRENPREVELLFKELLIGVTSFFRDAAVWEHLENEVVPALLRTRPHGGMFRVWVPGCSTGEEAYSLAMVFAEVIQRTGATNVAFQIFATDLDRDAIEKARQGNYPNNIAADVPPERLRRFFVHDDRGYRVRKELRETVVFAPQNLIMDPPFTKLDLLSCRNLLIYLAPDLQKKLIPLFHYALNPGGVLFLGSAETVGAYSNLFAAVDGKSRIYRRLDGALGGPVVQFPPAFTAGRLACTPAEAEPLEVARTPPPNMGMLADRVIVQRFAPTAVLTNDKGDILYISGRTGKYLEPAIGKANLNVFAMAREGLRYELSAAFASALKEQGPVRVSAIKVHDNGSSQLVDLAIQKLTEPKELRGTVMITIADAPAANGSPGGPTRNVRVSARIADLTRDLLHAQEEIQTTREEMQTSQEELKSTNEELQSTNEELQSSNEELTTSKEEMQSMNEELQTVNHELQSKVEELSRSNNDMKNLLNSTDIATLFLDGELLVRRFTTQTAKLIKLIPADAGRPITDIATDLEYPDLAEDAREVLRTLVFKEKQVQSRDGRWFVVRVLPYRTLENVIDGVVITFTDTTAAKTLESTLREQAAQLRQMTESLPTLVLGCRSDGACDYLSRSWLDYTGVAEAEQRGYGWLEQVDPAERERVREAWRTTVRSGNSLDTELRIRGRDGGFRWFKTRSVAIRDQHGAVLKWYSVCTDVDDLKQAAEQRRRAAERLGGILEGIGDAFFALDDHLVVTYVNSAAEHLLGRKRDAVLGHRLLDALTISPLTDLSATLETAVRDRQPTRVPMEIARERYSLRIFPHGQGISIFCQPVRPSDGGTQ